MPLPQPDRARFPYMPFFVDDWLSSDAVESFTLEQQAAYLHLLLRQWKAKDGFLPKDEARARAGRAWAPGGPSSAGRLSPAVSSNGPVAW